MIDPLPIFHPDGQPFHNFELYQDLWNEENKKQKRFDLEANKEQIEKILTTILKRD